MHGANASSTLRNDAGGASRDRAGDAESLLDHSILESCLVSSCLLKRKWWKGTWALRRLLFTHQIRKRLDSFGIKAVADERSRRVKLHLKLT